MLFAIFALTVFLCLDLAMTIALAQRVKSLAESAAAASMRDPALPRFGDRVGPFEVTTVDGDIVSDAQLAEGTALVGFFSPGCSSCALVRSQLLERPPRIPVYAFVDATVGAAEAREIASALSPVARVALHRRGDPVQRAFREAGTPTLVRLEQGTVTASGHRLADILP